jgi:hypothetical protein
MGGRHADVAQLVAHRSCKAVVRGSSPLVGSTPDQHDGRVGQAVEREARLDDEVLDQREVRRRRLADDPGR